MSKRLRVVLFVVAAVLAPLSLVGPAAAPAQACSEAVAHPLAYAGCMGGEVIDRVNEIPAPSGWQERHVCAISDEEDKSLCVFFPFPV